MIVFFSIGELHCRLYPCIVSRVYNRKHKRNRKRMGMGTRTESASRTSSATNEWTDAHWSRQVHARWQTPESERERMSEREGSEVWIEVARHGTAPTALHDTANRKCDWPADAAAAQNESECRRRNATLRSLFVVVAPQCDTVEAPLKNAEHSESCIYIYFLSVPIDVSERSTNRPINRLTSSCACQEYCPSSGHLCHSRSG